uniref:C2H2-type domain-containing protein n=1 Tax=Mastacembelus armatus TaxID=205130 RepID=A0A7N8X5R2_9TELE
MHCGHRYASQTACLQHEAFCDGVYKEGLSRDKSGPAIKLSNVSTLREAIQTSQVEGEAEYKCKFCTKTFLKSRNLRRHILSHNEVKPYRCKACDSCFSRYDHLKVHQTRCKGKRQRLEVCIPKISLDDVGKGWQNKFGNEPPKKQETFECEVCPRSFSTQSKLSRHVTMFHVTKLFKCMRCDTSFAHEKSLKKHKKRKKCRKVSNETDGSVPQETKPPTENMTKSLHQESSKTTGTGVLQTNFSCKDDSMDKSPQNSEEAEAQSSSSKEKKAVQYQCSECDMSFTDDNSSREQSTSQVSITGESDENENNSEDSDSDSAPYFPCHVCGKTFPTSESLEDHQLCHLGEKPHECEECGRCFFQSSQLQQHQRMHKSEFQCQACGRGFVSLFALRKHKHSHGKSRPYRCSKCPLSFTGPSQLAEHMSTHREENFPCDICNHVFLSKSSRAEHRKSHSKSMDQSSFSVSREEHQAPPSHSDSSSVISKELKYRCGVCSERFRDPEELSEHGCMAANERPYSCSDCDKYFLHASHLKKHRATHQLAGNKVCS